MLIQCTKKLLDELKIKPEGTKETELLFSWHANIIKVNRRKTVVLVNDQNRYVIVLHGLKANDFAKLDVLILQAIRETFQHEGITDEIIEQFIAQSNGITYTKTKDKTFVARMNKSCETIYFFEESLESHSIIQTTISARVSRDLVGHGKNKYIYPNEEMFKDLEAFAGRPIFSLEAAELQITLALEDYYIKRRLVVPVNRTFSQLHRIIQEAFGWKNYHLYEFYIYDKNSSGYELSTNHSASHKEGHKTIAHLVYGEEAFEYESNEQMKLATEAKLSEYVPAKIKYNYDFGDDWQHYIEVEKVITDYNFYHPVCLAGKGNTPPEDVGGEAGFKDFLEIISDPNHPEYNSTVSWGRMQGYKEFDIETVNRILKKL